MNGDKFFLDTNVFVYAFDETDAKKSSRARRLIESGLKTGHGVISYQVMQEFCNVALRKLARPLRVPDLEAYLERTFGFLFTVTPSLALLRQALRLHERQRVAWYDALIVAAAQAAGCSLLYSEDLQHGQRFDGVTVHNPFL